MARAYSRLVISLVAVGLLTHAAWAEETEARVQGNLLAPRAFRAAAERVRPAVVRIETFGGVVKSGNAFRPGEGPTTGIILSSDGYILTSTFNFLDQPPVITVVLADGKRHVAKLLGRDDTRKICLLKIEGVSNLPAPEWAPVDQVQVGQWAVAVGVGFGDREPTLSAGMISAKNRVSRKAVQTDANLSPANYGGPLVNLAGQVIGVCVPLSPGSAETAAGAEWYDSGIGFAVPLHGQDKLLADLKSEKQLRFGYLAIQAVPHGTPPRGVKIKAVIPGFAAEKAGLQTDDEIVSVNEEPVLDPAHLGVVLRQYYLGDELSLGIKRRDQPQTIKITLGDMPPPQKPGAKAKNEQDPEKPPQPGEQPGM